MSARKLPDSREEPKAPGSVRLRLARLALQAALGLPEVLEGDPGRGRLRVTSDPPAGLLVGVSVIAQPDGRYGVDLSLIAEMVSLPELAEQVRARVRERARRGGLARDLGSINVEFASVKTREELVTAAAAAERQADALAAQERRLTAGTEAAAEAIAGQTDAVAPTDVPEAAIVEGPAGGQPATEQRGFAPGEAMPVGGAAAIAARLAALATDQAALAARQAVLAAEQAALVAEPTSPTARPAGAAAAESDEHAEERRQ